MSNIRYTVADPGFPVRGASTYDFAKFAQKLHEIERISTSGERVPRPLPRSANGTDQWSYYACLKFADKAVSTRKF